MENKQEIQAGKMNKMDWLKDKAEVAEEKAQRFFENFGDLVNKALDFFEKKGTQISEFGAGLGYMATGAFAMDSNFAGVIVAGLVSSLLTAKAISGIKKEEREKAVGNEYKKLAEKAGLTEAEVKSTIEKAINERAAKKATEKNYSQNGNGKLGQFKSLNNNDKGLEI